MQTSTFNASTTGFAPGGVAPRAAAPGMLSKHASELEDSCARLSAINNRIAIALESILGPFPPTTDDRNPRNEPAAPGASIHRVAHMATQLGRELDRLTAFADLIEQAR